MRFAVNPMDEEAFKRIINYPKRGIGNTSVDKLLVAAYDHDTPALASGGKMDQAFLAVEQAVWVMGFCHHYQSLPIEIERKDAFEASNYIAKQSGLLRELYEDKTIEGLNRYENVQELLNAIKEYVGQSREWG